ncbi:hypothetical protein ACFVZ1_23710, partial [Bacillus subtilis]
MENRISRFWPDVFPHDGRMGLLRLPLVVYPWFTWLVVLEAIAAVRHGSAAPGALLFGAGGRVGLRVALELWSARVLSPLERARMLCWLDGRSVVLAHLTVLAAGVYLPTIVGFWHRHPWLGRYEIVLALLLAAYAYLPGYAAVSRVPLLGTLCAALDTILLRKGLAV